jgi:thioredoxin family protein
MYPHERSLVEKLKDKPFALIGVNSDTDKDKLKEALKEEKITWRSFWNGPGGTDGPISNKWNVSSWPTIYILDHKGVIREHWDGAPREDMLDTAINALLKEAEAESGKK